MTLSSLSRRRFVFGAASVASACSLIQVMPAWATTYGYTRKRPKPLPPVQLDIQRATRQFGNKTGPAFTINGQMPGPLLRFTEGQRATISVNNKLNEDTSIHWHGIILPANMDGVPGLSFAGIKPKTQFVYEFDISQSGTYWYHSHSGLQEQLGHLGPLVIIPGDGDIQADRDHTLVLSDWTFERPHDIYRNLKVSEGYYNYQKRTLFDTLKDIDQKGLRETISERSMWNAMRMDPRDIADVTASAYTYLMNGRDAFMNWEAMYKPGEKVRLRLVNGSAMTYFDFRIPGLAMTVVAADGQPVRPVVVDEIRIATAETYDVIVQPKAADAYTLFAESADRSGFVRGTLTATPGATSSVPARRTITERGMSAMGMEHGTQSHPPATSKPASVQEAEHNHHGMKHHNGQVMNNTPSRAILPVDNISTVHQPGDHGAGAAMITDHHRSRLDEPGIGLKNNGRKVLVYSDLAAVLPWPDKRAPTRTITLHLTGNMQRYMWSFDGVKFSEVAGPIEFTQNERLRLVLVNDTMMDHPIHLHGMWMELENGQYPPPRKHTISLKPTEKVSLLITADALGDWAFHCHLLYHMKAGMFRVVRVKPGKQTIHGEHYHG
ncbi:copper resistance system multicopper oxidase [Aestuariibacter sp. A3R04]|uniref:copper resistance system multicopper oxidase n=1 Tax=Aestuariibacter sp. A3R04 TaxID=2841571 RepID=UPI001C07F364|nr:copper resistance system multicopper oxidase [Aestuariibacter sp. A3R04]MBU3023243.1 copper resistance system multicopper oxidase [Aestuariibacter sp. A3R04]